jgi:hypothetical protein
VSRFSIIPGERDLSVEEEAAIRRLHAQGRSLDDIARCIAGLAPTHADGVNRLAAMLAPKRATPRKVWKGKRRC